MRCKVLLVGLIALAAVMGGACTAKDERRAPVVDSKAQVAASHGPAKQAASRPRVQPDDHGHSHGAPGEVPAFETDVASLKNLSPTLSPAKFFGKQREGYEAAKAIPRTLAQLPCYCHCDKGFGHKSLHTCFVDDHAAHCAICIDEALLAYKLEKEEKLTPAQIRERIVAKYSEEQAGH